MKNLNKIRVLLVDDEAAIREGLVEYLEDYDFEVAAAMNAEEALNILAKKPHDVAIIDLRLSGMGGETMILRIHQIYPSLRFLIHTGSTDYRLSKELKLIGIQSEHVFFKPVLDLTQLYKGINNLVRGKEDEDVQ